jgi:hypothetical protein
MDSTDLSVKMRERADAEGLHKAHELRLLADDFDYCTKGFYSNPQTVPVAQFMSAWAKARRAWCKHTGEALI